MTFTMATLFATWQVFAAPMPGTSSSAVIAEKPGLFYSPKGFHLDSSKTVWEQRQPPTDIPSLVTIYTSPHEVANGQQAALTVRVDDLSRTFTLKSYVKKWMQDYSRFGFDVLSAKPIRVNSQAAFLLDIVSPETAKQMRQVLFIRQKTAVVLTCRDDKDTFAKTVSICNDIIRTFTWTNSKR